MDIQSENHRGFTTKQVVLIVVSVFLLFVVFEIYDLKKEVKKVGMNACEKLLVTDCRNKCCENEFLHTDCSKIQSELQFLLCPKKCGDINNSMLQNNDSNIIANDNDNSINNDNNIITNNNELQNNMLNSVKPVDALPNNIIQNVQHGSFNSDNLNIGVNEEEDGEYEEKAGMRVRRATKEVNNWESKVQCFRRPDYSDYCIYHNACFDGKASMVFLNKNIKERKKISGPEMSAQWDPRYRFPKPFPPKTPNFTPWGSNSLAYWAYEFPSSQVNPSTTWIIDGALWIAKPELVVLNPFFFAKDTLQAFDLIYYNNTVKNIPPLDYLAILRDTIPDGWQTDFLPSVILPYTKVLTSKNFVDLNINENSLMCAKTMVVMGDKPRLFSGLHPYTLFKEKVFKSLDLPVPPQRGFRPSSENYTPTVIITKRVDNAPRWFYNLKNLTNLLDYYQIPWKVLDPFKAGTSLKDQIEIISKADLYIIVHGGGVINSLFLPTHASIIEIFPYGMKNEIYEYLANTIGINYVAVRSWIKSPYATSKEIYSRNYYENYNCQNISSIEHNENMCVHMVKNAATYIPMYEMERALIDSFDDQGIFIQNRVPKMFYSEHEDEFPVNDYYRPENFFKDFS